MNFHSAVAMTVVCFATMWFCATVHYRVAILRNEVGMCQMAIATLQDRCKTLESEIMVLHRRIARVEVKEQE